MWDRKRVSNAIYPYSNLRRLAYIEWITTDGHQPKTVLNPPKLLLGWTYWPSGIAYLHTQQIYRVHSIGKELW